MDTPRSVLIVDPSEETREVLRSALEREGVTTYATAQGAQDGLALARRFEPDLIVLDVEMADSAEATLAADSVVEQSREREIPVVLLGTARRRFDPSEGQFVAKPYHYAPLLRKIEALLAGR